MEMDGTKKEIVVSYMVNNGMENRIDYPMVYLASRDILLGSYFPCFDYPMNFRILENSEREEEIECAKRIYRYLTEIKPDYKGSVFDHVPVSTKEGIKNCSQLNKRECDTGEIDHVLEMIKQYNGISKKLESFFMGL